jgi:hypothetical protein
VRLPSGAWLAGMYEAPRERGTEPLLHVRLPDVIAALGLEPDSPEDEHELEIIVRIPPEAEIRLVRTWTM